VVTGGAQRIPEKGTLLGDKYEIGEVIAYGGMAAVFSARHLELGSDVAVKILVGEHASNPEGATRFLSEARACARLRSEHVVRIYDLGRTSEGAPYMVMERLVGHDLADHIRDRGSLPAGEAAGLVMQACRGVSDAHRAGIVHRDLKPSNLFVARRDDGSPCVKVLDFGISKVMSLDLNLTATNAVMGTPHYMSPEQVMSSRNVDRATDIWALGVILYEALTGQRPFDAETITAISVKIATHPAPLDHEAIPEPLRGVIARCLEKEPSSRYPDVEALLDALAPLSSASTGRISAPPSTRRAPNAMDATIPAAPPRVTSPPPAPRSPVVSRTMAYALAGRVHVTVHGAEGPHDTEWEGYLAHLAAHLGEFDSLFVSTRGGALSAGQRNRLDRF
jgi:eukaryotic-like serine/threonine-protein kinase